MSNNTLDILTLDQLEIIIASAKIHQQNADKEWSAAVKACAVEIMERKQSTLLDRFTILAREETPFRHMQRALIIILGGSRLVKRNGKAVIEYAPGESLIAWNETTKSFDYDAKAVPEARYKVIRAEYKSDWVNASLKQIAAQDPPKRLGIDTWRKAFERYAENESLWNPAEAEQIKAILLVLNGVGGIPRNADIDRLCATTSASFDGKPTAIPA